MDKKTAQLLIEDTFNNAFNEEQFMVFTKNLLNDLESKNNFYTGNLIWDDYKEHINTYKRIGKYIDPEGEALDVLIVEVKSLTKLERARTALRNFVIKHLSKFEKDYALVAFYSKEDGGADWRFSFIKLEYRSELDEEKGKVKLKKEFTPAKRYSFLVGKYEKAHTAKNQLLPLLQNIANNPTIEELEAAFSIEKVTDEFFSQYKDLYIKLYEHFENDRHVKSAIELAKIDNTRFTKKLLGQIVFLYFLQKKGWLGVTQNERWGTGKKRFVQELFDQAKAERVNFFKDKLQYLFYEALAKERDNVNSYYERFDCRIPFLNGGLFEADYDWQNANITIPESLFRNEEKNKAGDVGTGVLDVFDRYNFTIKEDEPLDKEVAVDPEMLGKVFENMLDIKERKSKGAFYTPREIVHYMCQESLIHYLDNTLDGKVKKEDIEDFIRNGLSYLENDINALNKIDKIKAGEQKSTNAEFKLPESIRQNADLIDQKLIDIRICDPAIGSGAFPVGLLHELVNAMLVLKSHLSYDYLTEKLKGFGFEHRESVSDSRYIYRLKRHIIQESIYGVDIDASAIDIARLRLWLSLVVDEDDLDPIETLPNLDYKIVCGNSLISRYAIDVSINDVFVEFNKNIKDKNYANKNIKKLIGEDEVNLHFYKKITNDFLSESSHEKKNLFRDLIKEIKGAFRNSLNNKEIAKLSKARGVLNNLQLIDMFGEQKGTPKQISEAKKSLQLLEKKREEILNGKIYKDAIEWRFEFPNLLDDEGNFMGFDVVIGNPPYLNLTKNNFDNDQLKVFEENFTVLRKAQSKNLFALFIELGINLLNQSATISMIVPEGLAQTRSYTDVRKLFSKNSVDKILTFKNFVFSQAVIGNVVFFTSPKSNNVTVLNFINDNEQTVRNTFSQNEIKSSSDFIWVLNKPNKVLEKLESKGILLRDLEYTFSKGMVVQNRSEFLKKEPRTGDLPFILGKDLSRFYLSYSNYANYDELTIVGGTKKLEKHLITPRILIRRTGAEICASYSANEELVESTCYIMSGSDLKLLTGLLNSSPINYYLKSKFITNQQGYPQILLNDLILLPIKFPKEKKDFEIIVDYLIFLGQVGNGTSIEYLLFNSIIDGLSFEAYLENEIKISGKEILKHLGNLKPINDEMSEEEKLAVIQSEFERLYDPNHPVRFAIETLDSVEEVRIIKEALK